MCHHCGTISYEFGPMTGDPDLSLVRHLEEVSYIPFSWASSVRFVSMTLFNGKTGYDVFMELRKGPYDGMVMGGIHVTQPNGLSSIFQCDPDSIWPRDPRDGMGDLSAIGIGRTSELHTLP